VVTARLGEERIERVAQAWRVLAKVADPELPALSVCELGMIREVRESAGTVEIVFTPTYSGCPATEVIERAVREAVEAAGLGPARVIRRRLPPWTTDWMDEEGRRKLREHGIAPPGAATAHRPGEPVPCPRCGHVHSERLSAFGSTPCKALYRCVACREPFEHLKPI
jgi:ring-1,2-phenylacetyl-CoA epoxidase subunit PaaD